jgi:hypothetical protein
MAQPVPRHREIKEFLAKAILKKLSWEANYAMHTDPARTPGFHDGRQARGVGDCESFGRVAHHAKITHNSFRRESDGHGDPRDV